MASSPTCATHLKGLMNHSKTHVELNRFPLSLWCVPPCVCAVKVIAKPVADMLTEPRRVTMAPSQAVFV